MADSFIGFALRDATRALERLTVANWGDSMARDPKANRAKRLEQAATWFRYAASYCDEQRKRDAAPCPNPQCGRPVAHAGECHA